MGSNTGIQWTWPPGYTGETLNTVTGCENTSPGCKFCYSRDLSATRLKTSPKYMGVAVQRETGGSRWTGQIPRHPDELKTPLKHRKPRCYFVNSMSDTFHAAVPFSYIAAHFALAAVCPQHRFLLLTKRASRMEDFFAWLQAEVDQVATTLQWTDDAARKLVLRRSFFEHVKGGEDVLPADHDLRWPLPNVWLGVSVEDPEYLFRVDHLIACPAARRFVSYGPALAWVDFTKYMTPRWRCKRCRAEGPRDSWTTRNGLLECGHCLHDGGWVDQLRPIPCVDQVIIEGESGKNARPFHVDWARDLIACRNRIPDSPTRIFVKQMGTMPFVSSRCAHGRGADCPVDGGEMNRLHLRDGHGGDTSEWAEDLRVQEYPA